jgi:hypothetical protein
LKRKQFEALFELLKQIIGAVKAKVKQTKGLENLEKRLLKSSKKKA